MRRTLLGSAIQVAMILTAVSFLAVTTSAQVSKGSISGTVVDATGAAVVGADAKAVSVETNQSSGTATDSSGLFKLLAASGHVSSGGIEIGFPQGLVGKGRGYAQRRYRVGNH